MAVIKSQMHSFSVSGNLSTITANRKLVDLSVSPFIRNIFPVMATKKTGIWINSAWYQFMRQKHIADSR